MRESQCQIETETFKLQRGGTRVWGCHNFTFTHLSDLTALEGQRQWPSCKIPISWVCATVEMKREPCLYRAPGLSDYCLKTRGFAHDKDWSVHTHREHRSPAVPSLSLQPEELVPYLPAWLHFFLLVFSHFNSLVLKRVQWALLFCCPSCVFHNKLDGFILDYLWLPETEFLIH